MFYNPRSVLNHYVYKLAAIITLAFSVLLLVASQGHAAAKHTSASRRNSILSTSTRTLRSAIIALPQPPSVDQSLLIYRAAKQPIGDHNGVALWLMGDSKPGSIIVSLFASTGDASSPPPVPGSGRDNEPLWPAWISKPYSTNFSGWHRLLIPESEFDYRAAVGVPADAPPASWNTIDSFGLSSTKTDGVLYVNDICWANIGADGNATGNSSVVDDFASGDLSDWKVKGAPEPVSVMVPGVTSLQPFVKVDPVSLKLDYSTYAGNRRLLARGVSSALSLTGQDYLVSVPSSPFQSVYPDSLPETREITSRVSLTLCPEQTGCSSFVIYAMSPMSDVTVHLATDLLGIGRSIPRANVNVNVVKVWERQGQSVLIDRDSVGLTPELLVKDDREPLSYVDGQAPDIKTSGDPVTDIPAGAEKQFWVDVTAPANTPAGQYTCQMVIHSKGHLPFSITLSVNVLHLRLLSPAKQYVINYRGKIGSGGDPHDHVTPEQMSAQLADIVDHGFHYLSLTDPPDSLPQAIAQVTSFNFQTPTIYPVPAGPTGLATALAVEKIGTIGAAYTYLVPDGPSAVGDVAALKQAGLSAAEVLNDTGEFGQSEDNADVAIYPVQNPYVQQLLQTDGLRKSSTRDWLTWPAAQSDPQIDRLYSGYLLWKADLYGAYVSDYETVRSSNPYDDLVPADDPQFAALRPAMVTYPTQDGVIDTVQWEAIREGINDVRYLTTFYSALRECKDAKVDLVQVAKAETDVNAFLNQPFWLMSYADYDKGRAMITKYAIQLRKSVDSYNLHQSAVGRQSNATSKSKRRSV